VKIEAPGWSPSGATLVLQVLSNRDATFVAVPASGGASTTLFRVSEPLYGWSVSARGVFALAIPVAFDASRIAIVELKSGSVRWLAPPGPGSQISPVWSVDGTSVIFGRTDSMQGGGTIEQVRADGTGAKIVTQAKGVLGGALAPAMDTAQGILLYTEEFNGSQLFALDRASGNTTTPGPRGQYQSRLGGWRDRSPRVLAQATTSIVAPAGQGAIILWDDISGLSRTLASGAVNSPRFDPVGIRIVFGAYDDASRHWQLEIMNADGSGRSAIPGTESAMNAVWADGGIYFTPVPDSPHDLRVVDPAGRSVRTLFHTDEVVAGFRLIGP